MPSLASLRVINAIQKVPSARAVVAMALIAVQFQLLGCIEAGIRQSCRRHNTERGFSTRYSAKMIPDFGSDPMDSPEGARRAKKAWDAYGNLERSNEKLRARASSWGY